jgi:perosamine synthetase
MRFHNTYIGPTAIERVTNVLASGWINEGPVVKEFERALGGTLGLSHPVALNSGTAALHLALVLAGIEPGDEVILPAQTFVATGLVILMQRALPVFADIDPATGGLAPASVRDKITPRTKAILPVHWGGYPCDLDEIHEAAKPSGLTVIEDAAHALGASYRGRPIGSISRFTAFSFQAIKHLTTGDGGAICCLDAAEAASARKRRWFGMDRSGVHQSPIGAREADIAEQGFKYHMNDIAAALGLANLEGFESRLLHRRVLAAHYRSGLSGVPGATLLREPADREPAYWFFSLLVERRGDFIRKLAEADVPASVVDLGIDANSVFGARRDELAGQRRFDASHVALPVHEGISAEDAGRILEVIRSGW